MKKSIITIILSLLAIVLAVFLLILPGFDAFKASRENLAFEQEQLARVQAQREKLDALDKKYQDSPGELEKIIAVLPKNAAFADLLINLEDLASDNGLVMSSVDFKTVEKKASVSPPKMEGGPDEAIPGKNPTQAGEPNLDAQKPVFPYKTMAIILSLEGAYENFKKYLAAIEENKRLMDVARLNYGAKSSQETSGYSFGLELNVYYQ